MIDKTEFLGYQEHEYNPIIRQQTKNLLIDLIKKHKPHDILEIGTFIGYSSAVMMESDKDCFVTTVEKDKTNFEYAVKNLENLGFKGRFDAVNEDAYEFLIDAENTQKKYDFIFLDGPKGQYIKYLPYLKRILNVGGILMADDVLFYGLVNSKESIKHKHRSMVNNLRKFLDTIQNDVDFKTTIYDFEDGVCVSEKIN